MLDEFQPNYASIGAVYGYNGDCAAQALERNIPTVCDKPIAATWPQLEKLRALCADGSRVLLTEFPFRVQREYRAARAAVLAGEIGEVVLATAQKSYRWGERPAWYAQRASYGGTVLWVASHAIDAIRFCAAAEFHSATGTQGNMSQPQMRELEDHCTLSFGLANGGSALVHADYLRPTSAATHGDDRLRLAGTRGIVEVRDGRCTLVTHDTAERDITHSAMPREVHEELLAALRGENHEFFSTAESLKMAEILLRTRDAADARAWHAF